MYTVQFYLTFRFTYYVFPLWTRVELEAMAINGYSAFPKAPA